jgi:isocitrate/isopropylmalate dehydrogenase
LEYRAGAGLFRNTGGTPPAAVLQNYLDADAVVLDAIAPLEVPHPDGTEVRPDMMVALRRAMGLDAAVRSGRLSLRVRSPLRKGGAGIEFVIILAAQ